MKHFPLIVFSDFDGTISQVETLEGFLQLFMDKDLRKLGAEMISAGYTVKDGVKELISRIPTAEYQKKKNYFDTIPIRPGFAEFVNFLKERKIPLVVLSGGIREMVTRSLNPYMKDIEACYAAEIDLSGEQVRFWSDYETEYETVGKCEIMSLYQYDQAICIGDSYSDFRMGMAADLVFARDRLADEMKKAGMEYFAFETFYDIMEQLKIILKE